MPAMELQTAERPLASFVLLAYNNAPYVAEALRSAFSQTYRPLQIVVSDDASTDATWQVLNEVAVDCPSDIALVLRRNPANCGVADNLNDAVAASSGEVIVTGAGDDIAEPERVTRIMAAFGDPGVMTVGSGHTLVNSAGVAFAEQPPLRTFDITLSSLLENANAIGGATAAYRRTVFESFDPLSTAIKHEDMLLVFRALLLGRGRMLAERLVRYRQHTGSVTASAAGMPASRIAYVASARRHAEGLLCARRQQLTDLAHAVARGLVDKKVAADIAGPLADQLRDFGWVHGLLTRELRGAQVLQQAIAAKRRPRAIAKLMAMNLYPSLWYWWLRLRSRSAA
ncbi:MAG: glycosyl transferase, group 2 family protein [Alphaproteobacteria bacterium]|jgi:GT2 family glycosyltransferase|nr:glycosyl transferase, group 2 family protein [Alphaproteobacteria bacterium]